MPYAIHQNAEGQVEMRYGACFSVAGALRASPKPQSAVVHDLPGQRPPSKAVKKA